MQLGDPCLHLNWFAKLATPAAPLPSQLERAAMLFAPGVHCVRAQLELPLTIVTCRQAGSSRRAGGQAGLHGGGLGRLMRRLGQLEKQDSSSEP